MKKCLIIAAHPDDEVLGCGGILSKYQGIVEFKVLFLGEGSSCRYNEADSRESVEARKIRANSALRALSMFGIQEFEFNNILCGQFDLYPILKINKIIEKNIAQFEPDTVLTHSESDVNNDHRIAFRATEMATRPVKSSSVKRLCSYEVLSSTEWGFVNSFMPNIFDSLSESDISNKWKALKEYSTEIGKFPHPRSHEGIKALAMYRGMQSNNYYAEAYKLIREYI